MHYQRSAVIKENNHLRSPLGINPRAFFVSIIFNDLPDCLKLTTPCMYADDTQVFASSYNTNELILKFNSDLAQVLKRLIKNKLQMHLY